MVERYKQHIESLQTDMHAATSKYTSRLEQRNEPPTSPTIILKEKAYNKDIKKEYELTILFHQLTPLQVFLCYSAGHQNGNELQWQGMYS